MTLAVKVALNTDTTNQQANGTYWDSEKIYMYHKG